MADLGTAYVRVAGDFTGLRAQLVGLFKPGGDFAKLSNTKKAVAGIAAIGTAGIAAGKALYEIGEAFDDVYDDIRTQTGKTGKELEGLKDSFREVVRAVPADFETAGKAVSGLNQRLGLTGKPLERLSKQLTELSRITETDVEDNVTSVTRAFGDWEVKTRKQAKTLDFFFRASQASGASVSELTQLIVQFGAPLRRFGFSVEEATSMFALFEKSGVNIQTMIPGLKLALSEFLEAGKDPERALAKTFEGIESGAIKADEAIEIFGKRAGADMVEAIEQGRFEFEEFTRTIAKGDDTIRKAGRQTMDFGEQWTLFKNNVLLTLEPVATRVFEGIGDAMKDVTKIMSDPKLTSGEKLQKMLGLAGNALDKLASKVGGAAPEIAGAFVKGFLNAGIWTRLFAGAWLIKALGGMAMFRNAGKGAGKTFGRAYMGGMLLAIPLLLPEAFKLGQKIGKEIKAGADTVANAIEGLFTDEDVGTIKDARDLFKKGDWGFETTVKGLEEIGFTSEDAAKKVNKWLGNMGADSKRKMEAFEDTIRNKSQQAANALDEGSKRGAKAVDRNMGKIPGSVSQAMRNANRAADKGGDELSSSLASQLRKYGIKNPEQFLSETAAGGGRKESGARRGSTTGYQAGGLVVPGQGSGDKVPILAEPKEVVWNREAVKAMGGPKIANLPNEIFKRFAVGGMVGMQPGISRLVKWAADRYGLRVSSGVRSGTGSLHNTGEAADLVPPGMAATKGIFAAFKNQLNELFYDPWGGFADGQMIGAIGDHLDHIHAGILGAGAGGGIGGVRAKIKLPRFQSTFPLGSVTASGVNRNAAVLEKAASRAASRSMGAGHGNIGDISGPLQGIARRLVGQRWGKGQWPFFNDLVMRESGWDPTAVNPSSGAAGLAQALPPSKYPLGAWPYTGKPSAVKQLQWMVSYIAERYGTPAGAIAWHDSHNWYQEGGIVGQINQLIKRLGKRQRRASKKLANWEQFGVNPLVKDPLKAKVAQLIAQIDAQTGRRDTLRGLLADRSASRLAESALRRSQMGVMPVMHDGGIYRAPIGRTEGPAILKDGETVSPAGANTYLLIEDGAVNGDYIREISKDEYERRSHRDARKMVQRGPVVGMRGGVR